MAGGAVIKLVLFYQTLEGLGVGGDLAIHRCEIETRALRRSSEMVALVPARDGSAPDQSRDFADEREPRPFSLASTPSRVSLCM